MPWPTPQEYNEAIQHPALCFADADLRAGVPDVTSLGLPRPITGNFASVYRLRGAHHWAVRCFFREYADSGERYAAISAHLAAARLPHTVGFQYLERGIRIGPNWFPVLKMQWVEGELLGDFVAANRHDPAVLRLLSDSWLDMLSQMEQRSIAHGDLQHGNVLVVGNALRLVDYDGMFVPALKGRISHEVGHPNYQHPSRTGGHFSADLDRFSGWIVYLSLLALQRCPSLWDDLHAGDECLLFRRADFESPQQSPALGRLRAEPPLRPIADQVERILDLPAHRIPAVATLEPRRARPAGVRPAPRSSSLPEWLEGSVPSPPARRFVWPAYVPRLLALLTACITLTVSIASSLPLAGAGAVGVAMESMALWLVYSSDPAVLGRTAARRRLHGQRLQIWSLSLLAWLAGHQARLAQRGRSQDLARLARTRTAARKEHERSLVLIEERMGGRVDRLEEALGAIAEARNAAEERVLRAVADQETAKRLRTASILTARIDGLGFLARCRLWLSGIRTARYVSPERVEVLRKLQPGQAAAVLRWRVQLEKDIRKRSSPEVPRHIARLFDAEYGRIDTSLRGRRRREERRTGALSRRAALVLDVDLARIDARITRAALREERVQRRHADRLFSLEEKREILRTDTEMLLDQMEPLRHLTFRRYLRSVVGFGVAGRS